jgi:hypothetical protein
VLGDTGGKHLELKLSELQYTLLQCALVEFCNYPLQEVDKASIVIGDDIGNVMDGYGAFHKVLLRKTPEWNDIDYFTAQSSQLKNYLLHMCVLIGRGARTVTVSRT